MKNDHEDPKSEAGIVLPEKFNDAMTPGYQVEFDPEEADLSGAFVEDAIGEQEAIDSAVDLEESE